MNELVLQEQNIKNKIFTIRDMQVMIDKDLAELYGVETKVFNQAVKRNIKRFPKLFRFQLTQTEKKRLVTNCDRFKTLKHSSSLPYAFTEQGVSMLSAILKSDVAIEVSIKIIESFVSMRKLISSNNLIFQKFENIEQKLSLYDDNFNKIFSAIESKELKSTNGVFYDGQMFDAYVFVADIIKKAKSSIVLIDNFCDETVLMLLSKRASTCKATIYTKTISKQLQLDVKKHNEQYAHIEIKKFNSSHDRFIIIDDKEVYHIGASLKDLGKKWFGFSKMDSESFEMMKRIEK